MSGGQDPHNRRFMPDWAFDKTGRSVDERPGYLSKPSVIFAHVKKLIALRNASPALQTGSYSELWRQNGAHNSNVWAYLRSNGKDHVIVVYNNGSRWTDVAVPLDLGGRFGEGTRFIDALGQVDFKPVLVSGGKLRVGLPGRSAVILVPRPWQASPKKIAVSFQVEASTYWGPKRLRDRQSGRARPLGPLSSAQARAAKLQRPDLQLDNVHRPSLGPSRAQIRQDRRVSRRRLGARRQPGLAGQRGRHPVKPVFSLSDLFLGASTQTVSSRVTISSIEKPAATNRGPTEGATSYPAGGRRGYW
jgi:hypothetical protein